SRYALGRTVPDKSTSCLNVSQTAEISLAAILILRAVCIRDRPLLKAYKEDVITNIDIKIAIADSIRVNPDIGIKYLSLFLKR
ncbi:hypothetical protein D4R42_00995, partial [bacterium]